MSGDTANKHRYGRRHRPAFYERQRGQIAIAAMALIGVAIATAFMVYQSGEAVQRKTRLVNAADAAAYSAGTLAAQQMNFMAYGNRAMVANHLAAGHAVSYLSWLRTINEAYPNAYESGAISIGNFFFGSVLGVLTKETNKHFPRAVGGVMQRNQRLFNAMTEAYENEHDFMANIMESVGSQYLSSQQLADGSLPTPTMNRLEHLQEFTGGCGDDVTGTPKTLCALETTLSAGGTVDDKLQDFMQAQQGAGDMGDITRRSLESDELNALTWFKDRGWSDEDKQVRLTSDTSQTISGAGDDKALDWQANDTIETSEAWETEGDGQATAQEFDGQTAPSVSVGLVGELVGEYGMGAGDDTEAPPYTGMVGYYKLMAHGGDGSQNQSFEFAVLATEELAGASGDAGDDNEVGPLASALAEVRVSYQRPRLADQYEAFTGTEEYANLFNPFWRARLK